VSVAQTVKRLHSAGTMTKVAAVGGVHNVGRESVLLSTQATRTKEEAAFNIGAGILADYALGGLSAGLSAGNRAALDAAVRRSVDMDTAGNPARVGELLNQEILDTPR